MLFPTAKRLRTNKLKKKMKKSALQDRLPAAEGRKALDAEWLDRKKAEW